MKKPVDRLGVIALDKYFTQKGWLFREQTIHDYGIDAQVEITDDQYPTGDLIAIQIKSGSSYFNEETETDWIFRTEDKHITYWINHSLPVIIVLYNPKNDQLFWQVINGKTVVQTGKNWKISIPKKNIFQDSTNGVLSKLIQPEPYIQRINKLRLDRSWIEKLYSGEEVYVTFSDWVNKSLSRYQMTITSGLDSQSWPMTFGAVLTIENALEYFIPWADVELDLDAHREASEASWEAECYMGRDKETDTIFYSESFSDWYREPSKNEIIPCDEDGECAYYKLQLVINDIGKSFLTLDSYLSNRKNIEQGIFTAKDVCG